ncbi:MAG: peptide MFS transporter [Bacteroidetes bacterium]|nr:peptide MFS transporter [Bacteroidota bacterium]
MKSNKHPKALPYLFFAEMWERFGYYLIIGIFVQYLMEKTSGGGFSMSKKEAYDIYGTFIAFVFLTPFVGGLIADRKIGYVKSVIIGAILMGVGYCGLSIHHIIVFYISLALIIIGNGFFKPNISTLLGNLYNDDRYRSSKDAGYNIFYMGINIGALICNFIAAYLRNEYGWGYAFLGAGIGMFLGLIVFILGLKHYKAGDVIKPVTAEDTPMNVIFKTIFLPAIVFGAGAWFIPGDIFGSDSSDAFIFSTLPVIYFYYTLYAKASVADKKPIAALLVVMLVSVMFWAVFKQNGTALTTWAKYYTDRSAPAFAEKGLDELRLMEKVPTNYGLYDKYDKNFNLVKEKDTVVKEMGYDIYLRNYSPQTVSIPGDLKIINTEMYQSINPFWVVCLTPLVVGFFMWLKRRGKEVSTPSKIAWGLFISALSPLVMVLAVVYCHNGLEKASSWWLIGTYGVVTVGELCLSPMGLSLVSKLSPPRLTALMMGGWFLSTSIGNKLSGILASMWDVYDNKQWFFMTNTILLLVATIIIVFLLKWLNSVFKSHTNQ